MRVLVVEDQKVLADRIAEGLRDQGMAVDVAYDGATAMEITAFTGYDVIVLDRGLSSGRQPGERTPHRRAPAAARGRAR